VKEQASEKVDEAKDKASEVAADTKDKVEGKINFYFEKNSSSISLFL
jgi:vacuolar-type H+-ATPase subunit H